MSEEKIKYMIVKVNEYSRTISYDEEEYFHTFLPTVFGYKEATREELEVIENKVNEMNIILSKLNISSYKYILISTVIEFDLEKELEKNVGFYNKILEQRKKDEERAKKSREKIEKERAIKRKKYLEKKAEKLRQQLQELEENNKKS